MTRPDRNSKDLFEWNKYFTKLGTTNKTRQQAKAVGGFCHIGSVSWLMTLGVRKDLSRAKCARKSPGSADTQNLVCRRAQILIFRRQYDCERQTPSKVISVLGVEECFTFACKRFRNYELPDLVYKCSYCCLCILKYLQQMLSSYLHSKFQNCIQLQFRCIQNIL